MAMLTTPLQRQVLELVLSERTLDSAAAWAFALSGASWSEPASDHLGSEPLAKPGPTGPELVAAAAAIVPHLADFSVFGGNVRGLLALCVKDAPCELLGVVTTWLGRLSTSTTPFKGWLATWLVDDFAETALHTDKRKWEQALALAVLQEPEESGLRSTLLRHLDERLHTLQDDDKESSVSSVHRPLSAASWLEICWTHDKTLAPSAMFCAIRLASLLPADTAKKPELVAAIAGLRWARVLRPSLFENMVAYLEQLQIVSMAITPQFSLSPTTLGCLSSMPYDVLVADLLRLWQLIRKLHAASKRQAAFVFKTDDRVFPTRPSKTPHISSTSQATVAELREDLRVVPAWAFPDVLVRFLHLAATTDKSIPEHVVTILIELLLNRDDERTCLVVLAVMVQLEVATHPVWQEDSELFVYVVTELAESCILERSSPTVWWCRRMGLRHLVLACDVDLLARHKNVIHRVVPRDTTPFIRERLLRRRPAP